MADMQHGNALGACIGNDHDRIGDGGFDAGQRQLAGGQILVLQVDDDDGAMAHGDSRLEGKKNVGEFSATGLKPLRGATDILEGCTDRCAMTAISR
ncbi:hypothetical protein D9M71_791950 [compost metagenome]